MMCPLCGGPLHLENPDRFVCERSHELDRDEVATLSNARLSMALWMAIEALDNEAEALGLLARGDSADGRANQAAEDAQILRRIASTHAVTGGVR